MYSFSERQCYIIDGVPVERCRLVMDELFYYTRPNSMNTSGCLGVGNRPPQLVLSVNPPNLPTRATPTFQTVDNARIRSFQVTTLGKTTASHAVCDAVLYRVFSGAFSLASEYTPLCVCRRGHQGSEQNHRAGELSLGSSCPSSVSTRGCRSRSADRPITHALDTSTLHRRRSSKSVRSRLEARQELHSDLLAGTGGGTLARTRTSCVIRGLFFFTWD